MSFVSPVNSDGSAFDIYDTGAPVDITVDADAKTAPAINCPMAQIPADQVTDEMLANIVNKTKDAIENGDETLKGDAGTGILDKLDGNVAKNPNASDKTKQEATTPTRKSMSTRSLPRRPRLPRPTTPRRQQRWFSVFQQRFFELWFGFQQAFQARPHAHLGEPYGYPPGLGEQLG